MTDDATDEVERLRRAFTALSATARPMDDCPEPERLWQAARGELAPGDLRDVIDHTSRCDACAEAWRLAANLADQAPVRQASPRPRVAAPQWWRLAAAAAVVAAAVGVFQLHDVANRRPYSDFRDASGYGIVSAVPADEALPRDAFVLRWRLEPAVEGARYDIWVTVDDLTPVAKKQDLETPEFQVPAAALAEMPSGTKLLWQVKATDAEGEDLGSTTFTARLE